MSSIELTPSTQPTDTHITFGQNSRQGQIVIASPTTDYWACGFQTNTVTGMFSQDAASTELEHEFRVLSTQWRRARRYLSSANKMAMHPAYQGIIALGKSVIPLILRDLEETRDHWLWALYVLSKFHDPAPEGATFDEAVEAWLTWGRQQGLLG